jgi:hypothetical protein
MKRNYPIVSAGVNLEIAPGPIDGSFVAALFEQCLH